MKVFRILHLEDNLKDADLIRHALNGFGFHAEFIHVVNPIQFEAALQKQKYDVVLADNTLPSFSGRAALKLASEKLPNVPVVLVSGELSPEQIRECLKAGAVDCVLKGDISHLAAVLTKISAEKERTEIQQKSERHTAAVKRLLSAVQELSLARNLETVMSIVREAARELTGADGATFVLRDNGKCYYADENAIAPLWKGQRFPMNACISGWTMLNKQSVAIEDIYSDPRVPTDAYRPTFVKSLVMVPIRTDAPIGAIGNYWAERHAATREEIELLEALANTTAVAMENVQVYGELEQRVKDRTAELEAVNAELESFSYSVSHDLRAPLRHISGFLNLLGKDLHGNLSEKGKHYFSVIERSAKEMEHLIDDLLSFSRMGRAEMQQRTVSLNQVLEQALRDLAPEMEGRNIVWEKAPLPEVRADATMLRQVFANLLSNAIKYTRGRDPALIEIGSTREAGKVVVFVRDNGAGFNMEHAQNLFGVFQRLHSPKEFEGTGIGLANVRRIVSRHGGSTWAEAEVDRGATFYFSLPAA